MSPIAWYSVSGSWRSIVNDPQQKNSSGRPEFAAVQLPPPSTLLNTPEKGNWFQPMLAYSIAGFSGLIASEKTNAESRNPAFTAFQVTPESALWKMPWPHVATYSLLEFVGSITTWPTGKFVALQCRPASRLLNTTPLLAA